MKFKSLWIAGLMVAATAGQVQAAVVFTFTESGGNVLMTSSGTLNTSLLAVGLHGGWGDTGIQNWSTDLMGGTDVGGGTDTGFAFNTGTDYSAWQSGNPWTIDLFYSWNPTGSKDFSTYQVGGIDFVPGINVLAADMVGVFWTPDQAWNWNSSTFAGLGMNPGTYTVSDALTGESITYQIGAGVAAVPEPTSFALLCIGALGLLFAARKRRQTNLAA